MREKWADIEGKYKISNFGNIYSVYKQSLMVTKPNYLGYIRVELSLSCGVKKHSVHRLVAKHFLKANKNKSFVNHIDHNRSNNKVTNLEWCTAKENQMHMIKHGRKACGKGSNNSRAKLNSNQVIEIKNMWETGNFKQYEIAKKFNVHPRYISLIVKGKRWKHI